MTVRTHLPSFAALPAVFLFVTVIPSASGGTSEPLAPPPPPPPASSWEFRAELYGWFTSLDGDIGFRGHTAHMDASFDELFDHIDMAAALQLELRNGRWGFIADGFYCELSESGTPPGPFYDRAEIKMKQFIGELDAAYRFAEGFAGFVDVYGGFRYNYTSLDLTAHRSDRFANRPRDIDISRTKVWTDPLIGLRGQWNINEKWFLAGKGDIGGFGVGSDLAWSLQATVGYNFTPSVSVELGYRYLNTDYDNDGLTYDVSQAGAFLGLNYKF